MCVLFKTSRYFFFLKWSTIIFCPCKFIYVILRQVIPCNIKFDLYAKHTQTTRHMNIHNRRGE